MKKFREILYRVFGAARRDFICDFIQLELAVWTQCLIENGVNPSLIYDLQHFYHYTKDIQSSFGYSPDFPEHMVGKQVDLEEEENLVLMEYRSWGSETLRGLESELEQMKVAVKAPQDEPDAVDELFIECVNNWFSFMELGFSGRLHEREPWSEYLK